MNKYLSVSNYYKNFIILDTTGFMLVIPTITMDSTNEKILLKGMSSVSIKQLSKKIIKSKLITIQDYSSGINSLYIGGHVTDKFNNVTGIIIMQISPDAINKIMLEHSPENGLGKPEKSYLGRF